jgi:hypothetical protein
VAGLLTEYMFSAVAVTTNFRECRENGKRRARGVKTQKKLHGIGLLIKKSRQVNLFPLDGAAHISPKIQQTDFMKVAKTQVKLCHYIKHYIKDSKN